MEKNMKNWNTPSVEEVKVADTQYGGKELADFDNIYKNDEGVWEGTYVRS